MAQVNTKIVTLGALGLASAAILVVALQNGDIDTSQAAGTIAPAQRVVNTQITTNDALNESTASSDATANTEVTAVDNSVESSVESSMESSMRMRFLMSSSQSDDGGRDRHNGDDGGTDPTVF